MNLSMPINTRPMKGDSVISLDRLIYPVFVSPKYDGVRGIVNSDGVVVSASGKVIPNIHIQAKFGKKELAGLDGELIIPGDNWRESFQQTTGVVRSRYQEAGKTALFYVFDKIMRGNFRDHRKDAVFDAAISGSGGLPWGVICTTHTLCYTPEEVQEQEEIQIAAGMEGLMLRRGDGKDYYKHGRATLNEQFLLKLKRFTDSEAIVIGGTQMMNNLNDPEPDEFGLVKRSKDAVGLVGAGMLGTFIVRDIKTGVVFEIGTGFSHAQRRQFWETLDRIVREGRIVKYKFQSHGMQEKPRAPVFLGFRWAGDMT